MGLTNFDELNTLSTTETTKDDRHKATRKKIPIHDYFENMQISEEEKEKRVRLANLLLADVLFYLPCQNETRINSIFQKHFKRDTYHRCKRWQSRIRKCSDISGRYVTVL